MPPSPEQDAYRRFLERLQAYERLEPLARSRGPEKLRPVQRLAAALGHPERAVRVVHVAGTNGKGMTAAMIARLLQRAGLRTGLYLSPHVADVRERIGLDGAPIAEQAFAAAGHQVLDVADRLRERLHFSYFDLLTLIACVAFRDAGVPWAVLETGLGGLSDATNVAPKELCVLTRIGMDHLHVLGETLQAIAAQKLGIVTPGTPTVLAEQPPELAEWLPAQLAARGAPLLRAGPFSPTEAPGARPAVTVTWPDGIACTVPLADAAVVTAPRLACAANALAAAEWLLGPATEPAERAARVETVLATHLPGRLELRREQPVHGWAGPPLATLVLDGGHNAEAVAALHGQLARWGITDYTLVLSLQRDKLVEALRPPLGALLANAARLLLPAPQTVRAPQPAELEAFLAGCGGGRGPRPEWVADVRAALAAACETPERPVVAMGSFWMLGDLMHLLP